MAQEDDDGTELRLHWQEILTAETDLELPDAASDEAANLSDRQTFALLLLAAARELYALEELEQLELIAYTRIGAQPNPDQQDRIIEMRASLMTTLDTVARAVDKLQKAV